uniref:Uncharacterized protein n=1 Tax=Avena sativa TaxID=4498 RepID=A0ACD5WD78_AVESA
MAPPRSPGTSAKRGARPRAPPKPSPAPPAAAAADDGSNPQDQLLQAASDGDLRLLKRLVRALDEGRGRPREVVEAAVMENGLGALHVAAINGMLPVCRYLVEEIGVDVDRVAGQAMTPLVSAMFGGSMDAFIYVLDHGADPVKADGQGLTPLHYAAANGDYKMVELLLAKGVPVDPESVGGTPLHVAASHGHDEAMEILLKNNADYNKIAPGLGTPLFVAINVSSVKCVKLLVEAGADVNDGIVTPLASAADIGSTGCLKCLLEAGADPNVPDASGWMPIQIAALKGAREAVEILFPVTSCIPTVHDWSIDGIIHHAKSVFTEEAEFRNVRTITVLRSLAANSIKRNDYVSAAKLYSVAMQHDPHDATLFSNRSLCCLRLGDGQEALQDALACREMQPCWSKGCYRQGAALMLLKDYGGACDAFLDAAKLDPLSREIEAALRQALNSLKVSHGVMKAAN